MSFQCPQPRAAAAAPLNLLDSTGPTAPGISFSMKAYALIPLGQATFSEEFGRCIEYCAKLETTFMCPSTGSVLQKHQISTYFMFASMIASQLLQMKLLPSGLFMLLQIRLLGFKPRQLVKPHHQLEHPTFLYPVMTTTGSLVALVALHRHALAWSRSNMCGQMRPRSEERLAA